MKKVFVNEKEILEIIKDNDKVQKFLEKKEVIRKIFIPNKILNYIIK